MLHARLAYHYMCLHGIGLLPYKVTSSTVLLLLLHM